jgi:opacity protein-like surface antigen
MKSLIGRAALVVAALTGISAATAAGADEAADKERTIARGRVEFSTGLSVSSLREGSDSEFDSDSDSYTILNVPLRVGYFISRRAELEGETLFTVYNSDADTSTGAVFSGRVLYHFGDGDVHPFLSAGGGVGNSAEFLGIAYDADRTIKHYEFGAGIKTFAGSRGAFRLEYRYTHYSGGARAFDGGLANHRVLAGVSLFFR